MAKKILNKSGQRTKKGTSGRTIQYITRTKAVSKLQVTLTDFRRLCILKGIFPRNPPKKARKNQTLYHLKDIIYLSHEPLLAKFRELKTFLRRQTRLIGRQEADLAASRESNKPKFNLDHLVKERYPTFLEAIRDFDDPLSTLFLFNSLKADISKDFSPERVLMVERLCREWNHWVQRTHSLRKVFVSIKGYYFQADVKGNPVTWLVPHRAMQRTPRAVDFRVMLVFLQFYETFARFINFKVYKDESIAYPPTMTDNDESNLVKSLFGINKATSSLDKAYNATAKLQKEGKIQSVNVKLTKSTQDDEESEEEENDDNDMTKFQAIDSESLPLLNEDAAKCRQLFENKVFLISRETPFETIAFVIRCGGGQAISELYLDAEKSKNIVFTHQVVDRPSLQTFIPSRTYVQPQWVFDSFNERFLLPSAPYAPGQKLPPHLSPFIDDVKEGYVPEQRNQLRQWAGVKPLAVDDPNQRVLTEEEVRTLEEEAEEKEYQKGIKAETMSLKQAFFADSKEMGDNSDVEEDDVEIIGDSESEVSDNDTSDDEPEAPARPATYNKNDNERELAKVMMKKKDARLLSRMEFGQERRRHKGALLTAKREAIETNTKAELPKFKKTKRIR